MNTIAEEHSNDGYSSNSSATPMGTPNRQNRILGDEPESPMDSSQESPWQDEREDTPDGKRRQRKVYDEKPEESLKMPAIQSDESDDDLSVDIDAALERFADELQISNHTTSTDAHNNRGAPRDDGLKILSWGHDSLPADLDTGEYMVRSNLHTYNYKRDPYGLEDPFKNEIDDDEDSWIFQI